MIRVINKIRPDKCMECNTDRCIELYDRNDKPVNYTYLIDMYEKGNINILEKFDSRQLSYMRCKKCGKQYCIDWRNRDLPIPIRAFWYLDNFLNNNYGKR